MKRFLPAILLLPALGFSTPLPPTQIEQRIAATRQTISKAQAAKPNADPYNDLAAALVRRARETGNPRFCSEAQDAVDQSLRITPGNLDARKARVTVLLCQQRWAEALEAATAANKSIPDDNPLWGYIADAQIALGNYPAAEKAAQQMIDMRQVNPQGLERGAALRELFGFNDPALEFWNSALRLTSATDVEERAWIATRIARIDRILGRYDAAASIVRQALELSPDYPWALDEQARTLTAQKKFGEAVSVFAHRLKSAPDLRIAYELGAAQAAANDPAASETLAAFEKEALSRINEPANANLELTRYYTVESRNPTEAVRIAKLTRERTPTVDVLEAYARALAAQNDWNAARDQMALALKPGIKNPAWLLEAGRISQRAGDPDQARKYFQQALEAAPGSPLATEVIQALTASSKTGS